ncbi:TerC/Alx family metal homeostasis membrane protein [Legionella anisa]|uniref:TerC/Alx family metal homeostasis membrane protein n=1 Tax=Legionella anisa TaxID=28082 RepID=UPI00034CD76B|nr:TerC/Alx family metal homeostasis membrane protein [Legionella anisa]KTC76339.1 drug efflux protein [Legionella anisa]MCW8424257.1 TerC/Alx family metal homeostasis membrane protein [Legionella anisa]MCW8446625.1 TerC/Alx family metal homeostasis membrane protein [Legionella anisa]
MESIGTWWLWIVFIALILIVLSIDIFLLTRSKREPTLKTSCIWVTVWVVLALLFNVFLWVYLLQGDTSNVANQKALEFFAAYLIEESLSMDNVFVFIMIFKYFSIPLKYQRRLLLFGVLGAISMRIILIVFGIWLINKFTWILYLFGILLIYSATKFLTLFKDEQFVTNNFILKTLRKFFPITKEISGDHFIVKKNNSYFVTPLLVVLIFIEVSDLIFAIDSIPAVLGITQDPFIACSSNAFAILGLRAMYFILAHIENKFRYLNYGLALILGFIGIKMLLHDLVDIPIVVTLSMIVLTLSGAIIASKVWNNKNR